MTDFIARTGHSLDMGAFTFVAASGGLSNTTAALRIGTSATLRALITSDAPPVNTVMGWTPGTGVLLIDLSDAIIAAIGIGKWIYEITIVRSATGRKLYGTSGSFQVVASLPEVL
jgi:hypothetical protein